MATPAATVLDCFESVQLLVCLHDEQRASLPSYLHCLAICYLLALRTESQPRHCLGNNNIKGCCFHVIHLKHDPPAADTIDQEIFVSEKCSSITFNDET